VCISLLTLFFSGNVNKESGRKLSQRHHSHRVRTTHVNGVSVFTPFSPFLCLHSPLLTWFFRAMLTRGLFTNQLTGTIPTQLQQIPGLASLDLVTGGNNFCPMTDYSTWAFASTDYPGTNNCTTCASCTCQNGGTCSGGTDQLFSCSCQCGYFGANCELGPGCGYGVHLLFLPQSRTHHDATLPC